MNRRLLVAVALAALAGSAAAQPPTPPAQSATQGADHGPRGVHARRGPMGPGRMGPMGGPMMGFALLKYDANGDGKLTRAEFDKAQHAEFDKIDANKDGSATPEEMQAYRKTQMEERRVAMVKARFTEMDKDKNGQVSLSEFQAAEADHAGHRGGPPGFRFGGGFSGRPSFGPREMRFGPDGHGPRGFGPGGPGRGGPPGDRQQANGQPGQPGSAGNRPRRAGPGDADGDGKLTFAEFSARATEAFNRADANKDGTVTIAELQALPGPL